MKNAFTIAAAFLLAACGGGGGASQTEVSPAQDSGEYVGIEPVSGTPAVNQFGSSVEFTNGALLTVDPPTPFQPSPQSAGHTAGNRAVTMQVTAENKAEAGEYMPQWVLLAARAGTQECTRVFDGNILANPETPLLPGDRVTWKVAWSCPDASADELTVSAEASNSDPQGSGVWKGDFDGAQAQEPASAPQSNQSPAADANAAASLLAAAGLCYPPSQQIQEAMGKDFIVCLRSQTSQYDATLISRDPWEPTSTEPQCSQTPVPDKFGIVAGDTWFLTPTVNQPRGVMQKYAQVTGGTWLTWRQACSKSS